MDQTNNAQSDIHSGHIITLIVFPLLYPALLLLLSGKTDWIEGWIFSLFLIVMFYGIGFMLLKKDPALLKERFKPPIQKEQKGWDKIIIIFVALFMVLWGVILPLDAVRYGWSPEFPAWVKIISGFVYVYSCILLYIVFKVNTYLVTVVRIQTEREHKVVKHGPYRFVRHPMYLAAILIFISASMLLGSYWGLLSSLLLVAVFGLRCVLEEKALVRELEGYEDYTKEVPYRLIPFIF